jgi:hypothetical protein
VLASVFVARYHLDTAVWILVGSIFALAAAFGAFGVAKFQQIRRSGARGSGWNLAIWIAIAAALVVLFNISQNHG